MAAKGMDKKGKGKEGREVRDYVLLVWAGTGTRTVTAPDKDRHRFQPDRRLAWFGSV